MKQIIKNYSFNAAARTVTFTDFSSISLERVLLITNVTTNTLIYIFNTPSRGGTVVGNVLTLAYDTSAMSNSDKLQITYDCAVGDPTYSAEAHVTGNVAAATADSGNPVKIGGKYNATAPQLTDGQRGDLQLDSFGNVLVSLATKLDSNNDSVSAYTPGKSYSLITTAATTTVKTGAGILDRLVITGGTAGTIDVYDNTAASGSKIASFSTTNTPGSFTFEAAFTTGLTVVTGAATIITVVYR